MPADEIIITDELTGTTVTGRETTIIVEIGAEQGPSGAIALAAHVAEYDHTLLHSHANLTDLDGYDPALFDLAGAAAGELDAHNLAFDHAAFITEADLTGIVTRETLEIATTDIVEFQNVIITIGGIRRKLALDDDGLVVLEEV